MLGVLDWCTDRRPFANKSKNYVVELGRGEFADFKYGWWWHETTLDLSQTDNNCSNEVIR